MHTHTYSYYPVWYNITFHISYSGKPVPLPRPSHTHKPIPVSELGAHVTQLHGNSNQGFKAEYEVRQLYLVSLNVINVAPNYAVFVQRRGHDYCYR